MDAAIKALLDYGLGGIVIACLFWALFTVVGDHRTERKEWMAAFKELKTTLEKLLEKF